MCLEYCVPVIDWCMVIEWLGNPMSYKGTYKDNLEMTIRKIISDFREDQRSIEVRFIDNVDKAAWARREKNDDEEYDQIGTELLKSEGFHDLRKKCTLQQRRARLRSESKVFCGSSSLNYCSPSAKLSPPVTTLYILCLPPFLLIL
jgi:hypothetical protein